MVFLWIILGVLGGVLGLIIGYVLFLILITAFVPKKEYDKVSGFYRALFNFTAGLVIKLLNINVNINGKEKVDDVKGRFLLVSNHRSNFDPILTYYAFRKKGLAFVSKPENFKIIVAGGLIRKCCFIPIDRENPRNALKALRKASELIKNDVVSMGIYPEGTRSKECKVLDFHDGVFKIAQMAKVPVVVMTIKNTENIYKRKFLGKIVIDIDVLDVIDAKTVEEKTTHELSLIARKSMENNL